MSSFDPSLLQPTLTEADDAVGFDRPWKPWSLVFLTFFFGIIAGGGLLAYNYERLGMKVPRNRVLAFVVAAGLLLIGTTIWISTTYVPPGDRDAARMVRWGSRAVSCLIAIGMAQTQQRRYRLFESTHLPAGHLLKPALAAIGAAFLIELPFAGFLYILYFG